MCWVALDRAITLADLDGFDDDNPERWRAERDDIRAQVLSEGYDAELGAFTQSYGSRSLDASNLTLATVGFIDANDPRFVGTVRATARDLMRGGLVDRYRVEETDDGFAGEAEGTFTICTLWLCLALLQIGDADAAQEIFDRVRACANDLGLLAEELTPDGEQLGNYPRRSPTSRSSSVPSRSSRATSASRAGRRTWRSEAPPRPGRAELSENATQCVVNPDTSQSAFTAPPPAA